MAVHGKGSSSEQPQTTESSCLEKFNSEFTEVNENFGNNMDKTLIVPKILSNRQSQLTSKSFIIMLQMQQS